MAHVTPRAGSWPHIYRNGTPGGSRGEGKPVKVLMTRPAAHPAAAGPPGRRQPRCHTDSLDLGALPGAVPSARLHVRAILREWGLDHLADDSESVASEVIANSVQATRAAGLDTPVRLTLTTDGASVLVEVWDAVPAPAVPADPGPDSENGRGLLIVEALAEWWDCSAARGGGKLVRALITDARQTAGPLKGDGGAIAPFPGRFARQPTSRRPPSGGTGRHVATPSGR